MPNQPKQDAMYMDIARRIASESYATRAKVGCVIVKGTNILAIGWNGMPSGFTNMCELPKEVIDNGDCYIVGETDPYVLHAESNAIAKLARSTQSSEGSTVYVTLSPCLDCAKQLYQAGITRLVYLDAYRCESGLTFLKTAGVEVEQL
jgi:dCMP deaminase